MARGRGVGRLGPCRGPSLPPVGGPGKGRGCGGAFAGRARPPGSGSDPGEHAPPALPPSTPCEDPAGAGTGVTSWQRGWGLRRQETAGLVWLGDTAAQLDEVPELGQSGAPSAGGLCSEHVAVTPSGDLGCARLQRWTSEEPAVALHGAPCRPHWPAVSAPHVRASVCTPAGQALPGCFSHTCHLACPSPLRTGSAAIPAPAGSLWSVQGGQSWGLSRFRCVCVCGGGGSQCFLR